MFACHPLHPPGISAGDHSHGLGHRSADPALTGPLPQEAKGSGGGSSVQRSKVGGEDGWGEEAGAGQALG